MSACGSWLRSTRFEPSAALVKISRLLAKVDENTSSEGWEAPGRAAAAPGRTVAQTPTATQRNGRIGDANVGVAANRRLTALRWQRRDAVRDHDEAVAFERDERLAVRRLLAGGDRP